MLIRLNELATKGENFAFETTLASRSFAPWLKVLKENGYLFHLTFLLLDSPELAVSRVQERVRLGGHSVPEEIIRRRYKTGLKNFFELYKPIADSWQIYDNTDIGNLVPIASKIDNKLKVQSPLVWEKLIEAYDETQKK